MVHHEIKNRSPALFFLRLLSPSRPFRRTRLPCPCRNWQRDKKQNVTVLLQKHPLTASVSYFKKAIELDPDCYYAYHELALAHYGRGYVKDSGQEID